MTLDKFNQLPRVDAVDELRKCCHNRRWAEAMADSRPFTSMEQVLEQADSHWADAREEDILEAFSGHARIGDIELLCSRYAGRAMKEQGQLLESGESVIRELQQLNIDYEKRHGFIFIVCASGKKAEEMVALIKARIHRRRDMELAQGAREQAAITRLRLIERLSSSEQSGLL